MEITEKIKQVASIVEIASQYTDLEIKGQKIGIGLCPFHSEKLLLLPSMRRNSYIIVLAAGQAVTCFHWLWKKKT